MALTTHETQLRGKIIRLLTKSGFDVQRQIAPQDHTKHTYRAIQAAAKRDQMTDHHKFLMRFANKARDYCINGSDIDPDRIRPELRPVGPGGSFESNMMLWWNLVWWSMPYQASYGRRIRYMIWDAHHDAPIGMFILQSPLLRLKARDDCLNIGGPDACVMVNQSMSAQRVGAIPPYNQLIGGKMAALAMTANEVRDHYAQKYDGVRTIIENRILEPRLLFITTTGAFGKSSMYDRLKYRGESVAEPVGSTAGNGSFHVPDCIAREVYAMLRMNGVDTAAGFGHGSSRKMRLLSVGFKRLGLDGFTNHGLRREIYLFRLACNIRDVMRGKPPIWHDRPFSDLAQFWLDRWCVPRSRRVDSWRNFRADDFFREVGV